MATLMATAIVTIEAREAVATAAAIATAAVTTNAGFTVTPSLGADVDVSLETIEEAMTADVKLNADVSTTAAATTIDVAAPPAHEQLKRLRELLDVAVVDTTVPVPKAASATLLDLGQRKECKAQLVFPRRTEKCPLHLDTTNKLQSSRQKNHRYMTIFPPKAMTALMRYPFWPNTDQADQAPAALLRHRAAQAPAALLRHRAALLRRRADQAPAALLRHRAALLLRLRADQAPALLHRAAQAPALLHRADQAPALLHRADQAPALLHRAAQAPRLEITLFRPTQRTQVQTKKQKN